MRKGLVVRGLLGLIVVISFVFFASEFGREPSKTFGINASLPWSVLVTCPYAEQVR